MKNHPETMHFYASSVCTWITTNEKRNLVQLLKHMEKEGYPYSLYLVPVPHDAPYEIKMYQPQVEGTQWVGFFEPKAKR
jgi:hypothetical protein